MFMVEKRLHVLTCACEEIVDAEHLHPLPD
jgi:hypothetical protein